MVYLAYGSNVNPNVMKHRCPNSVFLGKGILLNHKLSFNGNKTNSYLTIEKQQNSIVPIAIYELSDNDIKNLDIYEGFPDLYSKGMIRYVKENKEINHGLIYIMNDFPKGMPSIDYLDSVIKGYQEIDLNINSLKKAIEDSLENTNIYDLSKKHQIKKRIRGL